VRKIAFPPILLTAAFVCLLPAAPAQAAGAARTFVSAAGSDSNNCINVATPCRHLAAAYAATAPNGEIYVLDPANYGSLIITGPVSIEGHGWASIAPAANSQAIIIHANAGDKINIIGVVLDGAGVANASGIAFTSGGGSLTVRDSVIRNFVNYGIGFAPNVSSQLFVSNTVVSDNGYIGISVQSAGPGTVTGVLDHVQIENNANDGLNANTGLTGTQTINITVTDSVSASNKTTGIHAESFGPFPVNIMVRNSTIANNTFQGLVADVTGATILITRSTITGNSTAWDTFAGGVVASYGDNNIDGNTSAPAEPSNPLTYK
jgi:hypothetical protein